MRRSKAFLVSVAMIALLSGGVRAQGDAERESPAADLAAGAWMLYQHKFMTPDGRVVDNKAGDISHSESQGYGLLMAVLADDKRAFDLIWNWTRFNLMVREDRLTAWRWDGAQTPHVTDKNNATDGDLLIAWALLRASQAWNRPDYRTLALQIAQDISRYATVRTAHGRVLMPGLFGFGRDDQADGPVVNLSYWVFPALRDLGEADLGFPADALTQSGLSLVRKAGFGPAKLPPDWVSLADIDPKPATSYPAQFGYEAIRIPLYLAWFSADHSDLLEPIFTRWRSSATRNLAVVDLASATEIAPLADPGYRAVSQLVDCSLGLPVDIATISDFVPTDYYPSTLHVLSLMAIAERYPTCLTGSL